VVEIKVELSVVDLQKIQRGTEAIARRLASGDLVARVGLAIERQAKLNASGRPGPNVRTGRLRASITVQLKPGTPVSEAVIGTNVLYAPPVEFGHRQQVGRFVPIYGMRRIRAGAGAGRYEVSRGLGVRLTKPTAPAYPFMLPSVQQVESSGEMEGVYASFCRDIERDWMQ
jgi:phage gpG-like protein